MPPERGVTEFRLAFAALAFTTLTITGSSPARKSAPMKVACTTTAASGSRRLGPLCTDLRLVALVALLLILAAVAAQPLAQGRPLTPRGLSATVNFGFMRLARDLSRAKARRRRFSQPNAVMTVLLGREAPLPLADASSCKDCIALTAEELAEYDGRPIGDDADGERRPLFLAVLGRIYDVSAGKAFYGPGRTYHKLVGRDASRAFCTGCLDDACLIPSLDGLSEAQRAEAYKWAELYEHHDKYKLVGSLRVAAPVEGEADYTAEDLEQWEREDVDAALEAEGGRPGASSGPRRSRGERGAPATSLIDCVQNSV